MKITMTIELLADNEIQFCDSCMVAADKLRELGQKAIDDGDHEQFRRTSHDVVIREDRGADEPEIIGQIKVSR